MTLQIKKRSLKDNSVDGSKIKILKDQAIRGEKQDGSEVELLKLGSNDELLSNGQEIALKNSSVQKTGGDTMEGTYTLTGDMVIGSAGSSDQSKIQSWGIELTGGGVQTYYQNGGLFIEADWDYQGPDGDQTWHDVVSEYFKRIELDAINGQLKMSSVRNQNDDLTIFSEGLEVITRGILNNNIFNPNGLESSAKYYAGRHEMKLHSYHSIYEDPITGDATTFYAQHESFDSPKSSNKWASVSDNDGFKTWSHYYELSETKAEWSFSKSNPNYVSILRHEEEGLSLVKIDIEAGAFVPILPTQDAHLVVKAYVDQELSGIQTQINNINSEIDGPYFEKQKFVIDEASELTSIELSHECIENSLVVCVGRLMVHKDEDFTVSVVGGVTVLTWIGDFATGGVEAIGSGDVIHVTFARQV